MCDDPRVSIALLFSLPGEVFLRVLQVFSHHKNQHFQINFDLANVPSGCALC